MSAAPAPPAPIFVTLAGSQAHGTARDGSDVDLRGVFVLPLSSRLSLFGAPDQLDGPLPDPFAGAVDERLRAHPTAAQGARYGVECSLLELGKLLTLLVAANPNALEILFADERDWLHETPAWRRLHASRRLFLTRKVKDTTLGYGLSQLKRIETHRSWLLHPPSRKPLRSDFGLPQEATLTREDRDRIERAVADRLRSWGVDDLEMPRSSRAALRERLESFQREALAARPDAERPDAGLELEAATSLGLPRPVVAALSAERRYRAALRHWQAYETWRGERNPARAELETRFGYDTKHAMHLLRLMRMGLGALDSGELHVRRADAAELLAVRDGALTYEELLNAAEALTQRMSAAVARSPLPADVDREAVDRLAFELMTRT